MSDWQPSPRYPDPLVHVVDESFARYKLNLAKVERLATGFRWAEGPVWFGDMRCLLWSAIPNNRCTEGAGAGAESGEARFRKGVFRQERAFILPMLRSA